MAALTPFQAAAANKTSQATRGDYFGRILSTPSTGDERAFETEFHHNAQGLSDRLFGALQKVLGGQAPTLNFVNSTDSPSGEFHASATPATNTINLDPSVALGLIDDQNTFHSAAVNGMPHEMAHLRQTPATLKSIPDREGGAQAFADMVSPIAAAMAKTKYDAGFYDGSYSDFVKAAQAKGRDWITGGQFGHAPVSWP